MSPRTTSAIVSLTLCSLACTSAPSPRPPPAPPTAAPSFAATSSTTPYGPTVRLEDRWYGWQIIPLDALAITGFVLGLVYDEPVLVGVSTGLFGLGSPLVHLANGELYDAGLSLGARAIVPAAAFGGIWLGHEVLDEVGCRPERARCIGGRPRTTALIGAITAAAVAPVLDHLELAWKTEEVELGPPVVLVDPRGARIGVFGRF